MSYEGYEEYLCTEGHYSSYSCWQDRPTVCGVYGCTKPLVLRHAVDETNGFGKPAQKVEIGWEDVPMKDHYGNAYFVKNLRFSPPVEGSKWNKILTEAEQAAKWAEWEAERAVFLDPPDKYRIYSGRTLLFTCDTEAEMVEKYDEFLSQEVPDLTGYNPIQ